jgi:hypothetical protein
MQLTCKCNATNLKHTLISKSNFNKATSSSIPDINYVSLLYTIILNFKTSKHDSFTFLILLWDKCHLQNVLYKMQAQILVRRNGPTYTSDLVCTERGHYFLNHQHMWPKVCPEK